MIGCRMNCATLGSISINYTACTASKSPLEESFKRW
jgi:hypothetical protein